MRLNSSPFVGSLRGFGEEILTFGSLERLANEQTLEDLAHFLGMVKVTPFAEQPLYDWPTTLSRFRELWGDVEGEWLTHTPEGAITNYGDFIGVARPSKYAGNDVFKVSFSPANVVIDLSPEWTPGDAFAADEGFFVLRPESSEWFEWPRPYSRMGRHS